MAWTPESELRAAQVQELSGSELPEGKAAELSFTIKVVVTYRPFYVGPPPPEPRNQVAASLWRATRPGAAVTADNRIAIGSALLKWTEQPPYQPPPDPDPRPWLREVAESWTTIWTAQGLLTATMPPLWRGRYSVSCAVHRSLPLGAGKFALGPALDPSGAALEGQFVVATNPAVMRLDNGLPIELSNLVAAVPGPNARFVETKSGMRIPFTMKHTGYPVLDLYGASGASAPAAVPTAKAIADAVRPTVQEIEQSLGELPPDRQIFSPVYRLDDEAKGGIGTIDLTVREKSLNQSLACQAAGLSAAARPKEPRAYDSLGQAIKTGLRALQWDPDNLHAYLWVARLSAMRGDTILAFDFFLTLIFRLRLFEKILAQPQPASVRLHQRVMQALSRRVRPDFWPLVADTARILELQDWIDLRFPSVTAAAARV